MSFKLSRQRYASDNCLYIEIAIGSKNTSKDILPVRYNKQGEGKNLVDPRDAVRLSKDILKRWNLDYQDENKKLAIVGLTDKDGKPIRAVFDFEKDFSAVERWAETTFQSMSKCNSCQRPMSKAVPYEHSDLQGKSFCSEVCLANRYRDVFGKEAPKVAAKKSIYTRKKSP